MSFAFSDPCQTNEASVSPSFSASTRSVILFNTAFDFMCACMLYQSWKFTGGTDAEAETPVLWPSDVKNWLIGKDPDAGKDWRQEEKGMTEDEMVGWHHQLNGHEFEQAQGVGDGQGSLGCCSPWGRKEVDTTERLNWTELNWYHQNYHLIEKPVITF